MANFDIDMWWRWDWNQILPKSEPFYTSSFWKPQRVQVYRWYHLIPLARNSTLIVILLFTCNINKIRIFTTSLAYETQIESRSEHQNQTIVLCFVTFVAILIKHQQIIQPALLWSFKNASSGSQTGSQFWSDSSISCFLYHFQYQFHKIMLFIIILSSHVVRFATRIICCLTVSR